MEPDRPPTARPSPARGVVLIAVAVVLGLFLLRAIDDGATSAADGDVETADDTAAPDDGDETDETDAGEAGEGGGDDGGASDDEPEPPPPELRPPGEITVIVLNGSGVQGAAAAQTEKIAGAGYQTAIAGNAPQAVTDTQVQHAEGYEAEARALAEAIGTSPDATATVGPELADVDLQGSQLVVLLGTDLAGG